MEELERRQDHARGMRPLQPVRRFHLNMRTQRVEYKKRRTPEPPSPRLMHKIRPPVAAPDAEEVALAKSKKKPLLSPTSPDAARRNKKVKIVLG